VENMGKVRNDNPKNSFGKKCLEKAKVKWKWPKINENGKSTCVKYLVLEKRRMNGQIALIW
jgi:hypothetical protein